MNKPRNVQHGGSGLVIGAVLALFFAGTGAVRAQSPSPVPLWPHGAPLAQGSAADDTPTLTAYLPAVNVTRTAVIVAPGGGYQHLSMENEGSDVARWLAARGVAAFVLKYRLGPAYHHPVELGDAQRAIRTVRAQAKGFGIAPDHVGIWGFSAGGHLAAMTATIYSKGLLGATDAIDRESSRPDFLILSYPVITLEEPQTHHGSRVNLLGEHADPALVQALSAEKHVTPDTPPTFIFSTTDDKVVPVSNSLMFYSALVTNGVEAEMHLYQHGAHGAGLAQGNPDLRSWPDLLATWMRARGLMGPAVAPAVAP